LKVIIAGSRDITDYDYICNAVKISGYTITEVVSGRARGVDTLGEKYAEEFQLAVKYFPADWKRLGRAAGPLRNLEMGNYADKAILVWDGRSPGTEGMMNIMIRLKKPYHLYNINQRDTRLWW
jgi:hypothetical protein